MGFMSVRLHHLKIQSAMEYLMTYGWAILVIAVVLGVLYSLGIFSPSNFAPKAQPGSCQVFRPNGPNTNYNINLEGTCSGELPQYVAQFAGTGYIVANTYPIANIPSYSINMWIYMNEGGTFFDAYTNYAGDPGCGSYNIGASPVVVSTWNKDYTGNWYGSSSNVVIPFNSWNMLTISLANGGAGTGTITIYLNGVASDSVSGQNISSSIPNPLIEFGGVSTGCQGSLVGKLDGKMSNVQTYNTYLTPVEISSLYSAGIGGAPVKLQNLTGWWPLNGNANDYSGNNNNGVPTNVIFTGMWQGGYTPP